jgi:HlyD family secretion protein
MILIARSIFAFFLSVSIFIYNPTVALVGIGLFTFTYMILYKLVRRKLQENGRNLSIVSANRFKLLNEGLGGIKDILLLGRTDNFIDRFDNSSKKFAYARGSNQVLSQVPRYFMELLSFGSMVALVLYLLLEHKDNLGIILPILSVYALAGFKLLPAFQQIYSSISIIKGNIASFENIRDDLKNSLEQTNSKITQQIQEKIAVKRNIILEGIEFTYPNQSKPTLQNLNLKLRINTVIGIVGPSGSGKSTLIDVLLGLVDSQKGYLKVDGETITNQNLQKWQNNIGFVPQSIFLSEESIAENVAFGVRKEDINMFKVKQALKLSHLEELIMIMKDGIDTKVGERGVQLSGGQRQRIGIARALYNDPSIIIFDEATSALDGITEKIIMNAIHDFSGSKTIIMIAHRLKTVEKCDEIYLIEDGQVKDTGTYHELIAKNNIFRKMVDHG